MIRFLRTVPSAALRLALLAALIAVSYAVPVKAQQRPSQFGPTYLAQGILPAQAITTAVPSAAYVVQNESSLVFNITGTFSGLTAAFQVSNDPVSIAPASANWSTVSAEPLGGAQSGLVRNITATGRYRVSTTGAVRVRLNVTALTVTGSNALSVTTTGSVGVALPSVGFQKRVTYSSTYLGLTPAASLTDLITIYGNATTTVRVLSAQCDGLATATGATELQAVVRSAVDTSGTKVTAAAAVPFDANDPAASSAVVAYSVNPTLGTTVGTVHAAQMFYNIAATTSLSASPWRTVFGSSEDASEEGVTLRGVAQGLAINGNGVSQPSGAAVNCTVRWTEE